MKKIFLKYWSYNYYNKNNIFSMKKKFQIEEFIKLLDIILFKIIKDN